VGSAGGTPAPGRRVPGGGGVTDVGVEGRCPPSGVKPSRNPVQAPGSSRGELPPLRNSSPPGARGRRLVSPEVPREQVLGPRSASTVIGTVGPSLTSATPPLPFAPPPPPGSGHDGVVHRLRHQVGPLVRSVQATRALRSRRPEFPDQSFDPSRRARPPRPEPALAAGPPTQACPRATIPPNLESPSIPRPLAPVVSVRRSLSDCTRSSCARFPQVERTSPLPVDLACYRPGPGPRQRNPRPFVKAGSSFSR